MALYYYRYRLEVVHINQDLLYEIQEAFWRWRDEDAGDWEDQGASMVLEARTPDDDETFDVENEDWQQELFTLFNTANGSDCKVKLTYWLMQESDENSIESEDPEESESEDEEDLDEDDRYDDDYGADGLDEPEEDY